VLIVSANPLARGGLAVLVEGMPGMKIVGATGVAEAASLAGQLLPDAVLLDAGEGEAEDLDAIARLATAQPGLPIVALASDHGAVSQALTFGAAALLPAAVDGETLAAALRASARGLVSIARADLSTLLPQEERLEPALRAPAAGTRGAAMDGAGSDESTDCESTADQRAHGEVPRRRRAGQAQCALACRSRRAGYWVRLDPRLGASTEARNRLDL